MKAIVLLLLLMILQSIKVAAWQKYELPCDAQLLEISRFILIREIGTKEVTNHNDGREIDKYLEPLQLPKGSPYCLAGQYYCFYEAAKILNCPSRKIPLPKTGNSVAAFTYAKRCGAKSKFQIFPDDLVVWQKGKSRFGHTERVVDTFRKGWIKTVGFNTKKYDSREKRWVEGVFLWQRNLLQPIGRLHLLGIVGFRKVDNVY